MKNIPIIDAHHHFWDLSLKKNPWLNANNQIPFRYGDYSSICKNFLISDYKEISKNHNIVKTVHMETEWDPKDPVDETKWLHKLYDETGFPNGPTKVSEIHTFYVGFCVKHQESRLSLTFFAKELIKKGYKKIQKKDGSYYNLQVVEGGSSFDETSENLEF